MPTEPPDADNSAQPAPATDVVCADHCELHTKSALAVACSEQKLRREAEMHALFEIAKRLSKSSGQAKTLQDIIRILESQLHMVRTTVMLLDPDGQKLLVAALRNGHTADADADADAVGYQRGEGITGQVLASGQPVIIPSIAEEPRFCDRLHERNRRQVRDACFICVPIVVGTEVVGTLATDLEVDQRPWLDEAMRTLTIVASMIGYDVRARRIERAERQAFELENLRLRDALEERFRPENIIGSSRPMREVYLRIRRVASSHTTVLIRGETGTGKELVASAIHYASNRSSGPFVRVNCAQLNENLLESEMFGHEQGAFTGALSSRSGRIEEAEGGTLFLDEIGDFPAAMQVKLLRFLQEREYERVGSNKTQSADVRVIAATNRDLETAVAENRFRQDLYYRIHVFPITLPPLRQRRDDVLLLANHFAEKYGRKMDKSIHRITTPAIDAMIAYHWPGNVRELENCIEHAVLLADDGVIHSHHLPPTLEMPHGSADSEGERGNFEACVNALQRDLISDALKQNQGNATAAARQLGITARMIRYKIKTLGIHT